MKFILSLLVGSMLMGGFALCAEPSSSSNSQGDFEIDKNLVKSLYDQSTTEAKVAEYGSTGIYVRPLISFVNLSRFQLKNNYYTVPYTDQTSGLTALRVQAGVPLYSSSSGFAALFQGGVGYTYKEATQTVQSTSGVEFKDLVKLHWLPISADLRLEYAHPAFPYVRPFVGGGIGAQWLYQVGKLDGLEQGFWIPFYQLSGGLVLFEGVKSTWFGGVQVGGTTFTSLDSTQEFKGWSLDLGATFHL